MTVSRHAQHDGPRRWGGRWMAAALVALAASAGPMALAEPAATVPCASEFASLRQEFVRLVQENAESGRPVFGEDDLLQTYPLFSTFGYALYRRDHDVAFLKQVQKSATLIMNDLLSGADADGDFLLERATWRNAPSDIEDVGFNALLALDMLSLSSICLELDMTLDALFWYQGARTVSRQLIASTFDARSGYFLPSNRQLARKENKFLALSALPALFPEAIGDNIVRSVLSNYVLKNQYLTPEVPVHYLNWGLGANAGIDNRAPESLLRTLFLLAVLDRNDLLTDAQRYTVPIRNELSKHGKNPADAYAACFECLIEQGAYADLLPRYAAVPMLRGVGALHGVLPVDKKAELLSSTTIIERFLTSPATETPDIAEVEQAVRNVYWAISSARTKWKNRTLFTKRQRGAIPGFDVYAAFDELVDDAIQVLHEVETRLSRYRCEQNGLEITVRPLMEKAAPSERIVFQVAVAVKRQPVEITSLVLFNNQQIDTLTPAPLTLHPGDPPVLYSFPYVPLNGVRSTILPIRFAVEARLSDGRRARFHYNKGVFITPKVSFEVVFPHGKRLVGNIVPLELVLTKHVAGPVVVRAEWFSMSGLSLREGNTMEMTIPAEVDSASVRLSVKVPKPCRPGAFSFNLNLTADGDAEGTITADLFRPFEWLYVGPFAAGREAISTPYPPENGIDLRATYSGAVRKVSWSPLPKSSIRDDGSIMLLSLVPRESVGYLYTVIKTHWEERLPMAFASSSPAVLFVNGEEVMRLQGDALGSIHHVNIGLARGRNRFLVKVLSGNQEAIYFRLGDAHGIASDEFTNDLAELIDGYRDFDNRNVEPVEGQRVVTLTFRDAQASSVSVIGTFNGWSPVTSMKKTGGDEWEVSLHLPPGRYAYRFLIDNSVQVLDPRCATQEPDGYGGQNSVLLVR